MRCERKFAAVVLAVALLMLLLAWPDAYYPNDYEGTSDSSSSSSSALSEERYNYYASSPSSSSAANSPAADVDENCRLSPSSTDTSTSSSSSSSAPYEPCKEITLYCLGDEALANTKLGRPYCMPVSCKVHLPHKFCSDLRLSQGVDSSGVYDLACIKKRVLTVTGVTKLEQARNVCAAGHEFEHAGQDCRRNMDCLDEYEAARVNAACLLEYYKRLCSGGNAALKECRETVGDIQYAHIVAGFHLCRCEVSPNGYREACPRCSEGCKSEIEEMVSTDKELGELFVPELCDGLERDYCKVS